MTLPISTQTLVNDIRVMSGLRTNQSFSDAQIIELLNDAVDVLTDKFVAALGHWFRNTVIFTLTGNVAGSNTFDLSSIPDFQMDQGLDWYPGGLNSPSVPVRRLGSFAERGLAAGTVSLGYVGFDRCYFTNGNLLFVDPYTASAGTYKLIYTPQKAPLALPGAVPGGAPLIATIGTIGPNIIGWTGTSFTQADVGNWLNISGDANAVNNGPHQITVVTSATQTTVGGTIVTSFPTSATATENQNGTMGSLPALLAPWALYLKLHASIAIRNSRGQPTADFEPKMLREERRIGVMAQQRSEGPRQAPITRRRRRGVPYGYLG